MTVFQNWGRNFARVVLVLTACIMPVSSVLANPVGKLPGRWTGWGTVTHTGGSKEQLRCVATYFVENTGKTLRQNLRCASKGYKIDVVAKLDLRASAVSGDWAERIRSRSGSVSGRMTNKGFNLAIRGQDFSAALALTTTRCKQSINIAPQGVNVSKISIGLAKC